jgi:hypothetical protein
LVVLLALTGLWTYAGSYGLHVLFRHGGTYWISVSADSPRLSPSMRLAIGTDPPAIPGAFAWRRIADGFEVADLPVLVQEKTVDHVLLARINPVHFRFEVRNASDGDKTSINGWRSSGRHWSSTAATMGLTAHRTRPS